jgi:Mitochondrial carrier protein
MLKFGIHDQLRVIFGGAADSTHMSLSGKLAAGSATGVIRTTLLHPLSVIRTRLTADMGATARGASTARLYSGIWDCVLSTWRRERLLGFYGGFSVAMISTVPYLAICFTTYDSLKALLPQDKESVHLWWYPVCKMGMAAGTPTLQAMTMCWGLFSANSRRTLPRS